jgi:adenylate cyclase
MKSEILVVDDTPANLRLLMAMLDHDDYNVRCVVNAEMAMLEVHTHCPDLILLDVQMPEMDGYELCKKLKELELTRDIPVIFLSALGEVANKVQGFEIGAVDYITKPFETKEVLVRISNQIKIRKLQKQLVQKNTQLEQQNTQLKQFLRDRIKAEALLREAEETYRTIFENTTEGIFQATAADFAYISANQALACIYGFESPAELIQSFNSMEAKPYISMSLRKQFEQNLEECGSVIGFEFEIYRRDGSVAWIQESVNSVCDQEGELLFYVGTVEDITDRKKSEAADAIRQNIDQLQMIAQAIPLAVLISRSADGEVVYANPLASSKFGIPSWDLIGRKIQTLYVDPDQYPKLLNAIAKDGYIRNYKLLCKYAQKQFQALVSVQPFVFNGESALLNIFLIQE